MAGARDPIDPPQATLSNLSRTPRPGRLLAAILLVAGLAPGLWWRSRAHEPIPNHDPTVHVARLATSTPTDWPSSLRVVGAWRLASRNSLFGGYSALLATPGNTLTAFSDLGGWLRFSQPGANPPARPRFGKVSVPFDRYYPDIEAATQDEARGLFWLSYEKANRIRRFEFGRKTVVTIAPRSMRDWPENGGAESMTRLADGRFIVLEEDPPLISAGGRSGLLFATDPEIAREPVEFVFRPPIGYAPSDMAALPDGRVLILLRTLDLTRLPVFKNMLIVADPAAIVKGKEWPWRKLADVDAPTLRENYEGLAIVPDDAGVTLWLISDDNLSRLQRTLLLELHWAVPRRAALP